MNYPQWGFAPLNPRKTRNNENKLTENQKEALINQGFLNSERISDLIRDSSFFINLYPLNNLFIIHLIKFKINRGLSLCIYLCNK